MKAVFKTGDGRLDLEANPADLKQAFVFWSKCVEVFSAPEECPYCQSHDIRPRYRDPQGYDYYEFYCADCGAKRQFGQNKDGGGLFAKEWEGPYQGGTGGDGGNRQPATAGAGAKAPAEDLPF